MGVSVKFLSFQFPVKGFPIFDTLGYTIVPRELDEMDKGFIKEVNRPDSLPFINIKKACVITNCPVSNKIGQFWSLKAKNK